MYPLDLERPSGFSFRTKSDTAHPGHLVRGNQPCYHAFGRYSGCKTELNTVGVMRAKSKSREPMTDAEHDEQIRQSAYWSWEEVGLLDQPSFLNDDIVMRA